MGAPNPRTDPTARPSALPVVPENIPAPLTERPHWVGWDWTWDAGRGGWTKPPLNARTGMPASSTDPRTWSDFPTALAAMRRHGWAGVGFVVTRDDPFTGIDLDKCRDPGTGAVAPWAAEIVAAFDSYTEITPTGTGLRIWIVGSVVGLIDDGKTGRRRGPVEIYSGNRYFTVTGHRLEGGRR